jgi:hypothetical protein
MNKLLAAIVLTASSAAFAGEPWSTADKALFGALTVTSLADMAQTLQIAKQPDQYLEINPLIGRHPSKGKVIGYFMITHALAWAAADYMSPKLRRAFLTGGIVISAAFVKHNSSIGLEIKF